MGWRVPGRRERPSTRPSCTWWTFRVAVGGHDVLARAAYGGRPGHPVLLGRAHWAGVRAAAVGDAGARGYLAARADVALVECGDLARADDVDTPEQLAAFHREG
jgi:nicotine blue oxidoreductase